MQDNQTGAVRYHVVIRMCDKLIKVARYCALLQQMLQIQMLHIQLPLWHFASHATDPLTDISLVPTSFEMFVEK